MDAGLLEAVMGPIWAALGAIGHKALTDAEDEAATGLVALGRRLLTRLRRNPAAAEGARPQLEAAAANVAADPSDQDFRAGLRGEVKKALAGTDGAPDPTLAADLTGLLKAAGVHVTAVGERSVAVAHNAGIISTGDHAQNTINGRGGA